MTSGKYTRSFAEIERLSKQIKSNVWRGTHRLSGDSFYWRYRAILSRCNNEKDVGFPSYGGRGIKCLWQSFEEFKRDMYESYCKHVKRHGIKKTQIDRVDGTGHYSRENCHWVTPKQNQRNKKNYKLHTYGGESLPLYAWGDKFNISNRTLWNRVNNLGWSLEKALLTPINTNKTRKDFRI